MIWKNQPLDKHLGRRKEEKKERYTRCLCKTYFGQYNVISFLLFSFFCREGELPLGPGSWRRYTVPRERFMAKNVNKEEKKWNHKRSEENIAPLQSCIHKRKRRSKKKKKKKKRGKLKVKGITPS
jgi:hypothetical protein